MNNQLFVCTYNDHEAFDISKQEGLLGFSTRNAGSIGSLNKILHGDLILLRDSRKKKGLSFFGLLEATGKISNVGPNASLVWSAEKESKEVIFKHRLPVKFIRTISRVFTVSEVLSWKWKKRYQPYNEYSWTGYAKLFSGNFLDEVQKNFLLSALEIDKPEPTTPLANDIDTEKYTQERILTETYRILRDTALARRIKEIHNYLCQICNAEPIRLPNGNLYAEAHHIIPLGKHGGFDVEENIICVCPNCHVKLDYGVIEIKIGELQNVSTHRVGENYVNYHNIEIYDKNPL